MSFKSYVSEQTQPISFMLVNPAVCDTRNSRARSFSDIAHLGTETRCLSHVHESTQVRAKFDTFSDLQRQKLGIIIQSYRICLHKTAQLVTL